MNQPAMKQPAMKRPPMKQSAMKQLAMLEPSKILSVLLFHTASRLQLYSLIHSISLLPVPRFPFLPRYWPPQQLQLLHSHQSLTNFPERVTLICILWLTRNDS